MPSFKISSDRIKPIRQFALWAVLAQVFVLRFLWQERTIYFWDFNTFWVKFEEITHTLGTDPFFVPRMVVRSMRHDVYNLLPVLPLAPLGLLFGTRRMVYLLSILNVLALPALASFFLFRLGEVSKRWSGAGLIAASLFLTPFFWDPLLFGFPDIGGLIAANLLLWIGFRKTWDRQKGKDLAWMAVLLAGIVIFRRWYLYWSVTFLCLHLAGILLDGRQRRQVSFLKWLIVAAGCVAVYVVLTWPLPVMILRSNYAKNFAAYHVSHNDWEALSLTLTHFGWAYLILCAVSAFRAFRDPSSRPRAVFICSQIVLVHALFTRTQDFDPHHYYLILSGLAVLQADLAGSVRSSAARALCVLIPLVTFSSVFIEPVSKLCEPLRPWLPSYTHYPMVRNDLDEVRRLADDLGRRMQPEDRIYVAASSGIMNSDILKTAEKMFGLPRVLGPKTLWTHSVDRLEGFPESFLDATYVVVCEPVQYHLRAEEQQVVGLLAEPFLMGEGIASSYRRWPEVYSLDAGVTAFVFERAAPLDPAAVQKLRESLQQAHLD